MCFERLSRISIDRNDKEGVVDPGNSVEQRYEYRKNKAVLRELEVVYLAWNIGHMYES